jgi:hypothetical protein
LVAICQPFTDASVDLKFDPLPIIVGSLNLVSFGMPAEIRKAAASSAEGKGFCDETTLTLSSGVDSSKFPAFGFCLVFRHLDIALLSHAGFCGGVHWPAERILLLQSSKANRAITIELFGKNRISGSPLSIEAKPNHIRLSLREFMSAAS